ncbi:S-layer homology domain-containing protein [Cohnella zeiphila]|uniref:S-layer homology domain-containing protein n=1 Tax=Cohnella zeiphila TaxID=2761120 RepID=A0A7X0VYL4_9BACL|nr:S-layer homology domain-containing protein [Cohnella zeiphila]MBB6734845.1 S-layer homology domain-containing protein [Cohnella zeiphila]
MSGSGTESDPYIVMTPDDLSAIRDNLSAYYRLGADIELKDYDTGDDGGWLPIGPNTPNFTGTLDGDGHAIRNLRINRPGELKQGLFGILFGTVKNLRMIGANVTGFQYVGILAGSIAGNVQDVYVAGNVNGHTYVGGLAGFNTGTIQGAFANVKAVGDVNSAAIGGLVGELSTGTIRNSAASGSATGQKRIGGLVGEQYGTIQNSYADVSVKGDQDVGGLVGQVIGSAAQIDSSYSAGTVTGTTSDYGGLVGGIGSFSPTVTNSFWDMDASGQPASAAGSGRTNAEMKSEAAYPGYDFASTWGIREGESYPYLLAPKPVLQVKPLSATVYDLTPGHDEFTITGTVRDGSVGEQVATAYDLKDASSATVGNDESHLIADGSDQTFSFTVPLADLDNGTYTLTVSAQDTYNPVVEAVPFTFSVNADVDPPTVEFETDGSESWSASAATKVTVNDAGSGVDASTLQYVWTNDAAEPDGGADWALFASGDTLTKSGAEGDWYLHVKAADRFGNLATAVSQRFRLDSSIASLSGLTLSQGTLTPAFASGIYRYEASVGYGTDALTVKPMAAASGDTVTVSVNGGSPLPVASNAESGQLALNVGENHIELTVAALNGSKQTYTIAVTRAAPSGTVPIVPVPPVSQVAANPSGGVTLTVDSSGIRKETQQDGTIIETVEFDEKTLELALDLWKNAQTPILTIVVNDTEAAVQVTLPAAWIASAAAAVPNGIVEMELNGSSFQLSIQAIGLDEVAKRLGVELKDLALNVSTERVGGQKKAELNQAASVQGAKIVGDAVDYKVTVSTTSSQEAEIREFGGTYMARAIVVDSLDAGKAKLMTAAYYDEASQAFSFIPAVFAVRSDGKAEMSMSAPHNSIYAILETGGVKFADLDGHWAKNDIGYLASKLVVNGVTSDRFAPDAEITRAEFTALLVRAMGMTTNSGSEQTAFRDVAADAWYAPAIEAAVKAGLAEGIMADRFAPDDRITREQLAVMVAKALTAVEGSSSEAAMEQPNFGAFADQASVSPWAEASVERVAAAGIITGLPDGSFGPSAFATRAQATVMLKRFLQHAKFID